MDESEERSITQFNAWARDFDRKIFWPFYFSNKALLTKMNPAVGSSILDVGCGTGILLQQLSNLDSDLRLQGIDIAPEMVKMARAKLTAGAAIVQQGSASELPFANGIFDCVTCATSFHHYPDPRGALGEMRRVLKKGGKLLLLDPFTNGVLRRTICATLDAVFGEKNTHLFSREQLGAMFLEAGFENLEQTSYLHYKLMTVGTRA